jgi:hypothetical protein
MTTGASSRTVAGAFRDWVDGKNPVQARIAVFEKVRDVPYAVIPELIDSRRYVDILKTGRGS